MADASNDSRLRLGISTCLLGERVRFDGGHKHDRFLTDLLGQYVEWVPVCPEVEVGMSIPREAVRLVGDPESPRMVGTRSGTDHTTAMRRFVRARTRQLAELDLTGYVFKKDSPSCGMERVRVYAQSGMPSRRGVGMFAGAFRSALPLIPVEEEGRLKDAVLRENFIERLFCYRRWRDLIKSGLRRGALVDFHTRHKFVLLAHSPRHYTELGRLVAGQKKLTPARLADQYGRLFMEALGVHATVAKHTNVLSHIAGFCRKHLGPHGRQELSGVIEDYHQRLVPLIVPITLLRHHIDDNDIQYVGEQWYLNPHPKELMLRNHV